MLAVTEGIQKGAFSTFKSVQREKITFIGVKKIQKITSGGLEIGDRMTPQLPLELCCSNNTSDAKERSNLCLECMNIISKTRECNS